MPRCLCTVRSRQDNLSDLVATDQSREWLCCNELDVLPELRNVLLDVLVHVDASSLGMRDHLLAERLEAANVHSGADRLLRELAPLHAGSLRCRLELGFYLLVQTDSNQARIVTVLENPFLPKPNRFLSHSSSHPHFVLLSRQPGS